MNLIGKKIIEARKLKGITQEEIAEMSNINLRTIQRIENNDCTPKPFPIPTTLRFFS